MAMTFTYESLNGWLVVTADWTGNETGDASGTTVRIVGELVKATTTAPTPVVASYTVTLTSDLGIDVVAECINAPLAPSTSVPKETYLYLDANPAGTSAPLALWPTVASSLAVAVNTDIASSQGQLILLFRGSLAGS